MSASAYALLAAFLALATWAHYAFWTWRFTVATGEDEVIHAETRDGWRLALGRRRPRGPARSPPVLLVHGIAANRASMDFPVARWSLSAHLAAAGFDCFALDLRGHGLSRRARPGAPRRWTFDDYLRLDVPAALDAVCAVTGQPAVLWVGHSQGGLLGMAACEAYPDRVAGLVALGAPAFFSVQDPVRLLARFGFLFTGRWNRFVARMLAPFSGYWHPPVSQIAINGRNVTRPVYRRVLVNVVEDISSGVLRQFARWIATDAFAALDGAHDYRAALASCRQPALLVAALADRIAPPPVVERAAERWGGEKTVLTVGAPGDALAYGHSDLLFGRNAPDEVFPRIAAWLRERSHEAADPPADAPPRRGAAPGP
ncbi:MAG TPA: alpha/beta hydrolase [Anaeromyxobacteraceae bacterium]|nr:alpha/beta hydrolase [Anaeromyxobacteraceae bacterium]